MKRAYLTVMLMALTFLGTGQGASGFFDDLLKPAPQQKKESSSQGQASQEEQPGLIDGLGGIFGAKKKDIDLFKKGLGVVQALQPIGEEEEAIIGEAVAVEAFSRFGGEYRNDALTRYVNLVGRTIGEVSDRPNLTYRFAILNDLDQNAFAAPGGYIFITLGLLKTLKNEAELAGVLAHEVAHVTQKHMLSTIRRGAVLSNVSELTLSAMKKDSQMFSNVIDEITDKLFTKGLDKDLEYEADVFGIEFAYRAGYNPIGLQTYLKTLEAQKEYTQSRFFSTHPATGVRIEKISETLGQYEDGMSLPFVTQRFQQQMKTVS
ncbi:MAG: M48 family metalloprotease [Nitrospirales bacterium]|nr:M48 family metalloprotease [Nitrospirales bacterium]